MSNIPGSQNYITNRDVIKNIKAQKEWLEKYFLDRLREFEIYNDVRVKSLTTTRPVSGPNKLHKITIDIEI